MTVTFEEFSTTHDFFDYKTTVRSSDELTAEEKSPSGPFYAPIGIRLGAAGEV